MIALIFAMLLCVILAVAVVALVAIPAHRQGRELLTPKGDEVVSKVRELTSSAVATVREKAGEGSGSRDQDPHGTSSRNG